MFEAERQLAASLPPAPCEQSAERRIAEGLCEAPPLLLVAQHLREDAESRARLVHLLQDIRHSVHWYWQWHAPQGAELGRYVVDTTAWVDGKGHGSRTAPLDQFFVERLSLASVERAGGLLIAQVRNDSAEPVSARVHEHHKQGQSVVARVRTIVLPGCATTEVRCECEQALLVYAEDNGVLWLHGDEDPIYVRDQTCAWMVSRDESIVVASRSSQRSFTLKGPARAIWAKADGLACRAELRALGGEAFDALVTAGLLRRL